MYASSGSGAETPRTTLVAPALRIAPSMIAHRLLPPRILSPVSVNPDLLVKGHGHCVRPNAW